MEIRTQYSLKKMNTFGVEAKCSKLLFADNTQDVLTWLNAENIGIRDILVLGEGSNILFVSDWPGVVIKPRMASVQLSSETDTEVLLRVGAGYNWDDFVAYTVANGYSGIENLSLIPGTVGAAPVQNIGAYGCEVSEYIEAVEVIDLEQRKVQIFKAVDCAFAYRYSVFKDFPHRFMVSYVTFRLSKTPIFKLDYGNLEQSLEGLEITPRAVREAVIKIRNTKLPDPLKIGSAGSFFKNPILSAVQASQLEDTYPNVVQFPLPNGEVKISAGWLIEKMGFKGYRIGDAGVYDKQALVIVNYGKALGTDVYALAMSVRSAVLKEFGVMLENEVNIVRR
jgi:UDP-N-acetylmuramate dehydrogenase